MCLSSSYTGEGQPASFGVTGGFQKSRDRAHGPGSSVQDFEKVAQTRSGPTLLFDRRGSPLWVEPWIEEVPWRRAWGPAQCSCLEYQLKNVVWGTQGPRGTFPGTVTPSQGNLSVGSQAPGTLWTFYFTCDTLPRSPKDWMLWSLF